MGEVVDLRCPFDRQRMFGRLVVEHGVKVVEGNLMEFSCDKCRKRMNVARVLHRFDMTGRLIESEIRFPDGTVHVESRVDAPDGRALATLLESTR